MTKAKRSSPAARLIADIRRERKAATVPTCKRCLKETRFIDKQGHCLDTAGCKRRQPPLFDGD